MTYWGFPIVFQRSKWSCELVSQDIWNTKVASHQICKGTSPLGFWSRSQKSIYLGITASTSMRWYCLEGHARRETEAATGLPISWNLECCNSRKFSFQASALLFKQSSASALFQTKTLLALMGIKEGFKTPKRFHPEIIEGKWKEVKSFKF